MRAGDYRYFDTRFAALAHRGGFLSASDAARENTLYAFRRAVGLGYRYLETDAHVSTDGVLFSFHDDTLDRVTDATGVPELLPWAELQRVRVSGVDPIPSFDELFDALPEARFNIDLKVPAAVEPLARTIAAHNAHDRVCVGSFRPSTIAAFRRLVGRRVPTAVGARGVAWYAYAPLARRIVRSPGVVLQIPPRTWHDRVPVVSRGLVRAAHRAGRAVHVWTINERAELERLIDIGVDGLVSDDIGLLKQVLVERELWEGN
ncbi:glycerophosphodiester phosphodiesterase family protein [Micropruina sonneratiae]|uniref:glycerophosphodiester phosphodiesterase family protein n=1 Tax=Micropruina sonneratiae TaxID=2986940 RepID=UPI002226B7A6|nr:glycerophosphodiester phosphodiesterase family protein [Micropruina sp. KQZ13P-5]MCW3157651.1 glycerophosphodiester phosphodiesterase family protein [Micropruina sp. KQZ13P-5]